MSDQSAYRNIEKKKTNGVHHTIDWILFFAIWPIIGAGLVTMSSFLGNSAFFEHQIVLVGVAFAAFFILSFVDFRFLKRTGVLVALFVGICLVLVSLFFVGHVSRGAQSWFRLGLLSIQPSDPAKVILILVLAKYFSRRHIEIANIRHILVSGVYALVMFMLILIQPNFGDAIIVFLIWLGMVLVSGISKKHLLTVFFIGAISFTGLWVFAFKDYQKARIMTFIHPLADIRGAGYNAYQSTIAVGSGQVLGKGIGYGTQSKLNFLPEYQTDFIFAAFSEEWGLIGVLMLWTLYGIVIWRVIENAMHGSSNFEILYGLGVAIMLMTNFTVNVGMNMGLLPVTGVPIPFMSYGGSHLVTEFIALGILMGMRRYRRTTGKDIVKNEMVGI